MPPRRAVRVVKREYIQAQDDATTNNYRFKCDDGFDEESGTFGGDNWEDMANYDIPPSSEDAAAMCRGCPLLALCDEYASVLKPTHGVWGGKVWVLDPSSELRTGSRELKGMPLTLVAQVTALDEQRVA